MRGQTGTGWQPLLEWAAAFALLAFAVIGAASIGLFVLPVALLAIALAAYRNDSTGPTSGLGALLGVGAVCLYVAFVNRQYSPCPPSGTIITMRVGEHSSCGGLDPMPWLTAGVLLAAAGLLGHLWLRRTRGAGAAPASAAG